MRQVMIILLCFTLPNSIKAQKAFYNQLGFSVTPNVASSLYESLGYKFSAKNNLYQCVGVFIPLSFSGESFADLEYNLNIKPNLKYALRLNTDFKLGAGRLGYKSIPQVGLPSEILFVPFGSVLSENVLIPIRAFYLKFGYGLKLTTNFNQIFINKNLFQLCIGYNFQFSQP